MRRFIAAGCAGLLGVFAACSSFEDAPSTALDGGSGEAGDSSIANDAPDDVDAGGSDSAPPDGDAEAGFPDMVLVSTGGRSFYIDRREVSIQAFDAFKGKVGAGDAGFPPSCAFKTALGPKPGCTFRGTDLQVPMHCVDWCDAHAFCAASGKRLCGSIADGGATPSDKVSDPAADEWTHACSGSNVSADRFPYGAMADQTRCNTASNTDGGLGALLPVGSFPQCEGSPKGLLDMSGNVNELTNACGGSFGADDTCNAHGGNANSGAEPCSATEYLKRSDALERTGFRCCRDL